MADSAFFDQKGESMDEYDDNLEPIETEALLRAAVAEILRHEDHGRFMLWLRDNISRYFIAELPGQTDTAAMLRAMATLLGQAIWNATPLPGNGFRPRPVPKPKRNDPCPCGSGRKFKRCCYSGEAPPPLETDFAWLILFDQLSPAQKKAALASGHMPLSALVELAFSYLEEERPRKAVQLLEPLFEPSVSQNGPEAAAALDALLNAYDRLGYTNKKEKLLRLLLAQPQASPLRSAAYQRRAVIQMDRNDGPGAWEAFKRAQQDSPDDPAVGMLEVQLHLADGRVELAAQRADFWFKRLRRQGVAEGEPLMDFFAEIRRDPLAAMAELEMGMGGESGKALQGWLDQVKTRPLPAYAIDPLGEDSDSAGEDEEPSIDGLTLTQNDFLLLTPPALVAIEKEWEDVFPLAKPFSVHLAPFGDEEAWGPGEEEEWSDFLHRHPQAFDSVSILDDLAAAVEQHSSFPGPGLIATLYLPVLHRSEAIVDGVLAACQPPCRLPWLVTENRPALRNLYRLAMCHFNRDQLRDFIGVAEKLLGINPADNQGIRSELINTFLRLGKDQEAVALADRYSDDIFVDLAYGRVLALFRLGRKGDAATALAEALAKLPKVPGYLCRERVKQPQVHGHGIEIGGDDQAWWYREEMRGVWQMTPDALQWLKKQCRV